MNGGIYEIRNRSNGKYYVGRAECFKARFNRHRYELRRGRHHCIYLQRAWEKYGESAFEFVIIVECNPDEAQRIEDKRLNSNDPLLYNVSRMSSGGDCLTHHPNRERIVARRSEAARRSMAALTPEERIRRYGRPGERNGMYGRRHTEGSRQKMSETTILNIRRGPEHPNFGLRRSEETRAKMSDSASSRIGEKNSFYGKSHTGATKAKIAAKRRGNLPSNRRAVIADGVSYRSVTEAARELNISPALVIYRLKSTKYSYTYMEVNP